MTRYTPLWEQQGSYAASQDRRLIGALLPSSIGFVSGMQVQPASGYTIQMQPGVASVPVGGGGSVLCTSDGVENLLIPTNPLPPAGQSRLDWVYAQARGNDLPSDGGNNNDWIIGSVQGTPAASPVLPALPPNCVAVAQLTIPNGLAAIAAGNITDYRPNRLSGLLEPALAAGAPFSSFTDPWGEVWVAKGGVNAGAWKKARDVLHARWYRNAALPFSAGGGLLYAYDAMVRDPYTLWNGSAFVAPVAGLYRASFFLSINTTAAGQTVQHRLLTNGSVIRQIFSFVVAYTGAATNTVPVACDVAMAAGDTCQPYGLCSVALNGGAGAEYYTFGDFDYLGTG